WMPSEVKTGFTQVSSQTVEQRPSTLSVRQGRSSVINCSYSDSASVYFPWYKQELGKGPRLLIDIRSNMATKEDQRLTVSLNKTARQLSLHIADSQPEDSAVYFCAASTHCSPDTCCLHSNLPVGQPLAFDTDLPGGRLSFVGLQVEANVLGSKSICSD
uniref:Ig-like domain-containing protein n=1 Tax=Ailuropoda melanoleuca TaxID=9646 RepID=G1LNZ2_AILME